MLFDLTRLKNNIEEELVIDTEYQFEQEELSGTDLIAPLKVSLYGTIKKDLLEGFYLSVKVTGNMILPCSVTLKPVQIPLDILVEGNLEELLEEIEENHKKIENSIDILPIIWENILMEIPMKVTSKEASSIKREGEGWKLVTEENKKETNLALEQLKDLL